LRRQRRWDEPRILEEVGMLYSFDRVEGWMRLAYRWLHIETGKTGTHSGYFQHRFALPELMAHWNRDPRWKYSPI
jgi:hypothetical protein